MILLFGFQFLLNLDLQTTKKKVVGIVSNKEERKGKSYITIRYYNNYEDKFIEGGFLINYNISEAIYIGDHIEIIYQRNFHNIYCEYKKPPYFLWLLICFMLLALACYSLILNLKKYN